MTTIKELREAVHHFRQHTTSHDGNSACCVNAISKLDAVVDELEIARKVVKDMQGIADGHKRMTDRCMCMCCQHVRAYNEFMKTEETRHESD